MLRCSSRRAGKHPILSIKGRLIPDFFQRPIDYAVRQQGMKVHMARKKTKPAARRVVSPPEWRRAGAAMTAKEKKHMRAGDALAAARS